MERNKLFRNFVLIYLTIVHITIIGMLITIITYNYTPYVDYNQNYILQS